MKLGLSPICALSFAVGGGLNCSTVPVWLRNEGAATDAEFRCGPGFEPRQGSCAPLDGLRFMLDAGAALERPSTAVAP